MNRRSWRHLRCFLLLVARLPLLAAPPAVGDKGHAFALVSLEGKMIRLSEVTAKFPVVLVVLRGYPGYQCPICNRQVQDYLRNAQGFADASAQVIFIYPGPPDNLGDRAKEFVADRKLPPHFTMLLDPAYQFTNQYGLRWNSTNETAYPSTFLIDRHGVVFFAKVSDSHGGRTSAADIIELVKKNSTK